MVYTIPKHDPTLDEAVLLYADSSSGGKFWVYEVRGATVTVRYGKVSETGKNLTISHDSNAKALIDAHERINKKRKQPDGYDEIDSYRRRSASNPPPLPEPEPTVTYTPTPVIIDWF